MPQLLKIARMGHPVLREKAVVVGPEEIANPEFQDFIMKAFGSPHGIDAPAWARQDEEDKVELWKMNRDEFKSFVGNFVSPLGYGREVQRKR